MVQKKKIIKRENSLSKGMGLEHVHPSRMKLIQSSTNLPVPKVVKLLEYKKDPDKLIPPELENIDPYVCDGNIGGCDFTNKGIIDTGAAVTLIDKDCFDAIPAENKFVLNYRVQEGYQLVDAVGKLIQPKSIIKTNITIVDDFGRKCSGDVYAFVVEDLPCYVLLGRPEIQRLISAMDFQTGRYIVAQEEIGIVPVYIARNTYLDPGETKIVLSEAHYDQVPFDTTGKFIIEPEIEEKEALLINIPQFTLNMPAFSEKPTFLIPITNISNVPIRLSKGRYIGHLWITQINEEEIKPSGDIMIGLTEIQSISDNRIDKMNYIDIDDQIEINDYDNDNNTWKQVKINENLTNDQRKRISLILKRYAKVFENDGKHPDPAIGVKHSIDTGNHPPIKQHNWRYSPDEWKKIHDKVEEYLKHGVIERSNSPWCNPIRPVIKPDLSLRLCLDLRKLNSITKKDSYPLHRIDEILDSLTHMVYFALIDLAAGYHQIPMDPKDKEKTAFATGKGLFHFNVLIEGANNGPATFQRYMDEVFKGLIENRMWVYIDDIIVFGKTWDEFCENLDLALQRLELYHLSAKATKTIIGETQIKVLGHIVGNGTIKPNPELVKAVMEFPLLKSPKDVRSFLGLVNYYRRFIKHLATVSEPIQKLVRNDIKWEWTIECQQAFEQIKELLTKSPVLRSPDFSRPFIIQTDASGIGMGAILSQLYEDGEHPVAFASHLFNGPEIRYSATERECLAVVWAVRKFNVYLHSLPFIVESDARALSFLMTNKNPTKRMMKWAMLLSEYDFTLRYRKGTEMQHVDSLSRYPLKEKLNPIITVFIWENKNPYNDNWVHTHIQVNTPNTRILQLLYYDLRSKSKIEKDSSNQIINNQKDVKEMSEQEQEEKYNDPNEQEMKIQSPEVPHEQRIQIPLIESDESIGLIEQIIKEQQIDPHWKQIIEYKENNIIPSNREQAKILQQESKYYTLGTETGGLYYFNEKKATVKTTPTLPRLVVPNRYRTEVIQLYHATIFGGHLGINRVWEKLARRYFWPSMYSDVVNFIKHCPQCQSRNRQIKKPKEKGSIPPPSFPFEQIGIDFIGPFQPDKHGNKYVLVFMDYFSRYAIAIPTENQEGITVANNFFDHVVFKFGVPKALLSDRGTSFIGGVMRSIYDWLKIKKLNTSAYHPQTNGLVERFNQTLINELSKIYDAKKEDENWSEYISAATYAYNTSIQETIGEMPYVILFGREPINPPEEKTEFDSLKSLSPLDYIQQLHERFNYGWKSTKERLEQAYQQYLNSNELINKTKVFNPGDKVLLHVAVLPSGDINRKFIHPWIGPYEIIARLSPLTYSIKTIKGDQEKIITVNISRIKPYYPPSIREPVLNLPKRAIQPEQPNESQEESLIPLVGSLEEQLMGQPDLQWEIEIIIDKTWFEDDITQPYYFIKWKGWEENENSWEPEKELIIHAKELIDEYNRNHPEKQGIPNQLKRKRNKNQSKIQQKKLKIKS
jgi:transposase InsO family protein